MLSLFIWMAKKFTTMRIIPLGCKKFNNTIYQLIQFFVIKVFLCCPLNNSYENMNEQTIVKYLQWSSGGFWRPS